MAYYTIYSSIDLLAGYMHTRNEHISLRVTKTIFVVKFASKFASDKQSHRHNTLCKVKFNI